MTLPPYSPLQTQLKPQYLTCWDHRAAKAAHLSEPPQASGVPEVHGHGVGGEAEQGVRADAPLVERCGRGGGEGGGGGRRLDRGVIGGVIVSITSVVKVSIPTVFIFSITKVFILSITTVIILSITIVFKYSIRIVFILNITIVK